MEAVLFSDWESWRQRCALALCDTDTQGRLLGFAHSRMERFVRKYVTTTNVRAGDANICVPTRTECWHRFETHAALTSTRQGKCYKQWLFARLSSDTSATPIDIVQGGASPIFRDVARFYLLEEFAPHGSISMNKPIGPAPNAPTLADLLPGEPDPIDAVAAHEYEQLATGHAREFFQEMSRRERIALLTKFEGVSLAHPALTKVADCRKSSLDNAFRSSMLRLATGLRQSYRDDGDDAVTALFSLVLGQLEKCLIQWKSLEKPLLFLFNRIGKDSDYAET